MQFGSVLITGGTGFLGNALVLRLLMRDLSHRVCVVSRGEHAQADMRERFNHDPRLRTFIRDVRDQPALRRSFEGIDLVIHAAALKRIEVGHYDPEEMEKTNINGTSNVIQAARDAGVKKVLFVSSDKAYQPISPYGNSKAFGENLVRNANDNSGAHGPKFAAVRYGNVWCSTGSVVPKWRSIAMTGKQPQITSADCTRFFMRIEEAVSLVIHTARKMQGGELEIPDLPAYRLGDLAEAMGITPTITGLPEYEKLHESMGPNHCSADARRMTVDELRGELWRSHILPLAPMMKAA